MGIVFFIFSVYFLSFMLVEALVNSCGALLLGASQVNILYLFGLLCTALGYTLHGFLCYKKIFYAGKSFLFSLISFVTGIIFLHTDNRIVFVVAAYLCLLFLGICGGYAHSMLSGYVNAPKFGFFLGISMAISIVLQFVVDTIFAENFTKGTVVTALLLINSSVAFFYGNRKQIGSEMAKVGKTDLNISELILGISLVAVMSVILGMEDSLMMLGGENFSYGIMLGASCILSIMCLAIAFVHLNMSNTVSNEKKDVSFQAKFSSIEKTALFTKERFDSFANTYQLTNKEREIFEILITTETATQEIADMFGISRRGLQRHVASIYEKTGTQTRVGLLISFTNM